MKNQLSSVRFDHREVAVIFSLFIFVSLLMFTVGILVGKGLQQAKYEGINGPSRSLAHREKEEHKTASHDEHQESSSHAGTSITTGHDDHAAKDDHGAPKTMIDEGHGDTKAHGAHAKAHDDHGHATAKADAHGGHGDSHAPAAKGEAHGHDDHALPSDHTAALSPGLGEHLDSDPGLTEVETSLDLVPAHPKKDKLANLDEWPKSKETEKVLKDPRMAKFLEGGSSSHTTTSREVASVPSNTIPPSFAQGKFTVQVGSYPNQREALDRVEALKKLGFPHSFFAPHELETKKITYRVHLGYFPDQTTAQQGGQVLQSRGEVSSYIVKKKDN